MGHPTDLIASELGPGTPQRRFQAHEIERMLEAGILGEDDPVELIGGLLIAAEPQTRYHTGPLQLLNQLFTRALDPRQWTVRIQMPVSVDEYSEPEPDLAVVSFEEARRRDSHPQRAALIIEVAHSSLRLDTHAKLRLYAAAGFPEYWVVDAEHRCVRVFADPDTSNGTYGQSREVWPDEELVPAAFPQVVVNVRELFE